MRILLVHNKYGKLSGEETVMFGQAEILRKNGHNVYLYTRSSEEISKMFLGKARSFFSGIYNPFSAKKFKKYIIETNPDIVHVHNLFPLISPSVIKVCKKMNIPVAMTLHNFRLVCPNGLFFTHGHVCEKCSKGKEWNCILNNCEHSFPKSVGYALRNWVARKLKLYTNMIDCFIALSQFQKCKLSENGIPKDRICVIPNMYSGDLPEDNKSLLPGDYVLYLGRFSEEKGIDTILQTAMLLPNIKFKLLGNGYEKYLSKKPPNVDMPGFIDGAELNKIITKSRIMVMASSCYEGFPMSLLDAMSKSKAVVVPDIGAFTEIINNGKFGVLFKSGDAKDMAKKVKYLYNKLELCREMGQAGKLALQKKYSDKVYYESLIIQYKNICKIQTINSNTGNDYERREQT